VTATLRSLTTRTPGLVVTEHELDVPLDHAQPDGPTITVFAREVAEPDGLDKPFLVYLQGGPGFEAVRPTRHPSSSGWMDRALKDFRVLMLDQRGTGRSTPVGEVPGTVEEQVAYLTCFRADSIVADAELLRRALGVERWSVLGQSFGGFCTLRYLSAAPEGLAGAYLTGGLPPIGLHPDEVYAATFARTLERTRRYYERYPQDRDRVLALHGLVEAGEIVLPDGEPLSWNRFRQHGNVLGSSEGAERLHHLLELPPGSPAFRHDVAHPMAFERNPVYAVLHEACYADGGVTGWSAERVRPAEYDDDPTLFTAEHVFPWMLEDYRGLRHLREAAEVLAQHEWPRLYDPEVLAANEVPCAAAVYVEDLYVESELSVRTAAQVRGLRAWVTNEYEHNGLRADGSRVLGRLLDLAAGR
jgi:pimeloyl-ACP methyl ester carboxylesterase